MSLLFAGVVEVLDVVLAGGELRVGGGMGQGGGLLRKQLEVGTTVSSEREIGRWKGLLKGRFWTDRRGEVEDLFH